MLKLIKQTKSSCSRTLGSYKTSVHASCFNSVPQANPVFTVADSSEMKQPTRCKRFMPISCLIFKFLSSVNLIPFYWEAKSKRFKIPSFKSVRNIHYAIAVTFTFIDFVYIITKFGSIVHYNWPIAKSDKFGTVIALFSLIGIKSVGLACHWNLIYKREEVVNFSNQLIRMRYSEGIWKDFPGGKVFPILLSLRTLQLIFLSFMKPQKSQFWFSSLNSSWKTTTVFIFHLIFNIQTTIMFPASTLMCFANLMMYAETVEIMLRRRVGRLETNYEKLLSYKKLQLLASQFRATHVKITVRYCTVYSFMSPIILSFGSIRYSDTLDLRVYLQMPISLLTVLAFVQTFYSRVGFQPSLSKSFLRQRFIQVQDYDSSGFGFSRGESRMCLKSCRQISLYRMNRSILLIMLRFVIVKTARLLVWTSQK